MEHEVTQRLSRLESRVDLVEDSLSQLQQGQDELLVFMEDIEEHLDKVEEGIDANAKAVLLLRQAQRDPIRTLGLIAFASVLFFLLLRT